MIKSCTRVGVCEMVASWREVAAATLLFLLVAAVCPGQAALDDWTIEHFQTAKAAQDRGELDKAAQEYQLLVSKNPRFAGAYLNLGIVYQLQNKYAESISILQHAVRVQPDLPGAKVLLGVSYYMVQDFPAALKILDQALSDNFRERQAGVYRALALLGLDRPEDAARQLRETARYYPNDLELAYQLGAAYSEGVRQSSALLLSSSRESALYHWAMAISAEQKHDWPTAILENLAALQIDPNIPQIYDDLAMLLEKDGFPDLAQEVLARRAGRSVEPTRTRTEPVPPEKKAYVEQWESMRSVHPDPNVPAIADSFVNHLVRQQASADRTGKLQAAVAAYERGDFAQALAHVQPATSGGYSHWVIAYLAARCHASQGSYERAEELLETSLRPQLQLPSVAMLKLEIQSRLALESYEAVLSKQPDSNRARILRAKAFAAAHKVDEAVEEFRTVLGAQPDLPQVHLGIAQIYADQLNWAMAIEELKQELALSPDNALALALLGHAYAETEEADRAIPILLRVVGAHPNDASAQADLGKAFARKGDIPKAIEAYENAVAKDDSQYRLHYRLYHLYQSAGQQELARRHLASYNAEDARRKGKPALLR
jgi:tetratricopeptide (TPR) repeat protein